MSSRKIKGIIVKLGLDTKEVTKGLSEIDKAMSKSSRELKEIDKALKLDPKNTELLAQKQQVLTEMLEKSRKKMTELEALRSKMDKAAANNAGWEAAYKPLGEQIDKVQIKLKKLEEKKEETDQKLASGELSQEAYDKYQKELEETRKKMQELIQKKSDLEKQFEGGHISAEEYRTYRRELETTETQITKLQTQIALLDGTTGKSASEFRKAVESTEEYKQAMSKLSASSSEAKEKIGELINFALKLGGALATAAVGAAAAAVKVGSQFDASMSSVQALSGTAGAEFDALREKAMEMGASTSKTASEAADALGYMALAGWDTQKMLDGIEPILRASEAGAMDLATCSDLVTDSMSSMGIAVEDLQHYLDVCTQAQSSANTSMEQLLQAYVGCGGMLKNLNVPMEESATILGTLANRGIKGSEAGNALNSILVNLIGANRNAASAMSEMGISAFDANGRFIGLEETLKLVKSKLDEYGDDAEKISQLEAKLGGKTQLDTLMALLSGVSEEYDTLYEQIENSNGALEETAAIMRDNLKGDVTTLTSALQDAGIQVNDHFTAAFRDAVQEVTGTVRELSAEFEDGKLGDSLEKIAAAFGKAIKAIAEFAADKAIPATVNFFEFIADHGQGIITVIAGIGGAFAAWKIVGVITSVHKAILAFNIALEVGATKTQALTATLNVNPWVLLTGAVITAAMALKTFIDNAADAMDTAAHSSQDFVEAAQSETEALRRERGEFENLKKSQQEKNEADQEQINNIERLWNELTGENGYVDSLGRVVTENERAEEIIGILNERYGLHIEYVDGMIEKYSELSGSMEDYIENLRNEARIRNNQPVYDEAVKDMDDLIAQREALKKLEAEEIEKYNKARSSDHSGGGGSIDGGDYYSSSEEGISERVNEIRKEIGELDGLIDEKKKTLEEYEGLFSEKHKTSSKIQTDAIKEAAKINGEAYAEGCRESAELAKKGVKQTYDDLMASIADLDSDLAIHDVDETTIEHYDKLAETEKKAQEDAAKEQQETLEKSIDNQIDALKQRNKLDSKYTEDMLYNDMEITISGLDKQSDIYKKYYKEILDGRKKLSDDMRKQTVEGVQSEIQALQSEYSAELGKITSEQNNYKNKLLGMANLYTNDIKTDSDGNKSGKFILENIDEKIKAVNEYDSKLNALEKRGAGKGLIDYVKGLSGDDEEYFTKMLRDMSDAELKSYSDKYDKLISNINEKAEARYQPQVDAVNSGFIEKIRAKMRELPGEMSKVGLQTIDGFIAGFTGDSSKLIEAVSEKCNEVIDGFKNGLDIHSPSKETAQLGEYAAEGFLDGLSEVSGADAAEQFADDFINKMAEKDPELRETLNKVFTGNMAGAAANMNDIAGKALDGVTPNLNLPDISGITLKGQSSSDSGSKQGSDERVTAFTENISERLDDVISLLTVIVGLLNREQVIKVEQQDNITVLLDGEVVTKTVSCKQSEHKRRTST